MCSPPFCTPAHQVFANLPLRRAAAGVCFANAIYGLLLVVIHSVLLAQVDEDAASEFIRAARLEGAREELREAREGMRRHVEEGGREERRRLAEHANKKGEFWNGGAEGAKAMPAEGGRPAGLPAEGMLPAEGGRRAEGGEPAEGGLAEKEGLPAEGGLAAEGGLRAEGAMPAEGEPPREGRETGSSTHWLVQVLDLTFSWGHQLFNLSDGTNLVWGLMYGIAILVVSVLMFILLIGSGDFLPIISRYFVGMLHLEVFLYIGLAIAKMNNFCDVQVAYLADLRMTNCTALMFMYIEQVAIFTFIFAIGTWIFSTFSFVLTFGSDAHSRIDNPDHAEELDLADASRSQRRGSMGRQSQYRGSMVRNSFGGGSVAGGPAAGGDSFAIRHSMAKGGSMVGGAVSVQPSGYYPQHQLQSSRAQPQGPQRTSYSVGRMPRASSSMVTSATADSRAETQALLKPPIAIF